MPAISSASVCYISGANNVDHENIIDSTNQSWGFSFTVASSCTVSAVGGLFKIQSGTPVDHVQMQIWSDSGGSGPSALLEAGSNFDPGGSYAWATSTFSSTLTLNTGTTYWCVAHRTIPNALSGYSWAINDTNSPAYYRYDGTNWNSGNNGHFTCEVDGGAAATPPQLGFFFSQWWQ